MKTITLLMIVPALAAGALMGCGSAAVETEGTTEADDVLAADEERRQSFETLDGDGDGFATREEINAALFAKVDSNGDGKISKEERDAVKPPRDGRGMGPGKGDGPRKGKGPGEGKGPGKGKGMHGEKRPSFEECDTNSDGFLTPDEFKGGDKIIEKADTDNDGKISEAEHDAMKTERGKKGHGKKGGKKGHGKHQGHEQDN